MTKGTRDVPPLTADPKPVCNLRALTGAALAPRSARAATMLATLPPCAQLAQVCDTRALHSALFSGFAPAAWPDAAGTYRGTPGSSMAHAPRAVFLARRLPGLRSRDLCAEAAVVPAMMDDLARLLRDLWHDRPGLADPHRDAAFRALAKVTELFFAIHPYMDGNGHIWRLVLPVLGRRLGLAMRPEWTVDRRPYGPEFSMALQWYGDHPSILADQLRRWLFVAT
jgi:hypothetical protein